MLGHNLFDPAPLVERLFADHSFASIAQVFYFGLIGIAHLAKVLKVDVDYEVTRNNLVLVLSNVFWTQLHLASLDVIAPLDKGGVEHDAAQSFVREAGVLENYLHVTLQNHAFLLLFCQ